MSFWKAVQMGAGFGIGATGVQLAFALLRAVLRTAKAVRELRAG
ncbi:hypothetical protein [Burkholderia vietnamiensis]|nr:hypothetical protein [Burkholderia vietnamiensis]